jgi:outer membrane protein assembly factor BamB
MRPKVLLILLLGSWLLGGVVSAADEAPAADAQKLVELSGVRGGLIVHVGCGDGHQTAALRSSECFVVHGLDEDAENVARARAHVQSRGVYGPVSIDQLIGPNLPYADHLVNLLIISGHPSISERECQRVLAPGGVLLVKEDGTWRRTQQPWPDSLDQWTHHLHDASGNAVARDKVAGPPSCMQWTAGPSWARSHGWTPTVTAMVSSQGRLFYICDETLTGAGEAVPSRWFVVARDAFSGVLLWKRAIANWGSAALSGTADSGGGVSVGRFTMPPHAAKRLVALGETVYVTLGAEAPVTALDAATGDVKRVFAGTARSDEILVDGNRLIVALNPPASRRPAVVDKEDSPPSAPGKRVAAFDVATGQRLWGAGPFSGIRAGRSQDPFGRLELCAGDGRVFLLTSDSIECRALESGQRHWVTERPVLPEDAVRRLGFSGMYEYQLTVLLYQSGVVLLAQPEPNTHHTYHTMPGTLYAFGATDGELLWKHAYGGWGHCTPPDVFVVDDRVWTHVDVPTEFGRVWGNGYRALDTSVVDYRIQALDLKTGEVRQEHSTKDIFNVGHHHRCYRNKITERYLMSSRRGVEFVDLESGENFQNHWVRSGCKVGNLPCNGMLYVAPHPCQCYIDAKLTGFNALAPDRASSVRSIETKLQRGSAYDAIAAAGAQPVTPHQWPTYRHDPQRSGATETSVDSELRLTWTAELDQRPGALTVAGGKVFTHCADAHRVCALHVRDGSRVWSFTAGARVSSPPTYYHGLAIFGADDGCVYCLRASDGELVWRFHAAPERRLVMEHSQLESAWPVLGVLVQDGACWCAAGRSSYLDSGIYVYALDARSGQILHEQVVFSPNPDTGKMAQEPSAQQLPGLLNDVPASNGVDVFIRQMCVSSESPRGSRRHLFTTAGYLDSSWFNRTFWKIGAAQTTGPMVLGDKVAYGIEPFTARSRDVLMQPGRHPYYLRCLAIDPPPVTKLDRKGRQVKGAGKNRPIWEQRLKLRGTSLVRAGPTVIVAGSPDVVDPADPHGAWEGRQGGLIALFAAADGAPLGELTLPAPPIWDGLAVADGRVYLALQNGTIVCLD